MMTPLASSYAPGKLQSFANRFLLPGTPILSYDEKSLKPNLVKIPKNYHPRFPNSNFIPCLHYPTSSNYLILYFHGNSEDLGIISELLLEMQKTLPYDFFAVEYPNYGLYREDRNPLQMLEDSETVFNYIKSTFPSKKTIVFGRSIGTGPAVYLASQANPEALVLLSAFKSIKSVLANYRGGSLWSYFSDPVFDNSSLITKVKCPILFLHGKLDSLVNPTNSKDMFESVKNENKLARLVIRPFMDHNQFLVEKDITGPINNFLKELPLKQQDAYTDLLEIGKPKI